MWNVINSWDCLVEWFVEWFVECVCVCVCVCGSLGRGDASSTGSFVSVTHPRSCVRRHVPCCCVFHQMEAAHVSSLSVSLQWFHPLITSLSQCSMSASTAEMLHVPTTATSSSAQTTQRPWRYASRNLQLHAAESAAVGLSDSSLLCLFESRISTPPPPLCTNLREAQSNCAPHVCVCVCVCAEPVPSPPWRMCVSTSPESRGRWWWVSSTWKA